MTELLKRTHVYIQHPRVYQESGCPVDDTHMVTWSEYEHNLWCFECKKDFVPKSHGIFDGFIGVGVAEALGLSFDRVNIKTGEIVKFEPREDFDWDTYNKTWNHGEEVDFPLARWDKGE